MQNVARRLVQVAQSHLFEPDRHPQNVPPARNQCQPSKPRLLLSSGRVSALFVKTRRPMLPLLIAGMYLSLFYPRGRGFLSSFWRAKAYASASHLALCMACSGIIMKSTKECPLCRTRIVTEQRLLRIFKS